MMVCDKCGEAAGICYHVDDPDYNIQTAEEYDSDMRYLKRCCIGALLLALTVIIMGVLS